MFFSRKRNSCNPAMFKGLEHPSGFPSMLRGTTPVNETSRPSSALGIRKDSQASVHQPVRRHDSNGVNNHNFLQRKDSAGSSVLNRRDSFGSGILNRKDSNSHIGLTRKDSADFKPSKRDSLNDDFRRLSFGNSIYLRPDSTGATNLCRRDSFGPRDSTDFGNKSHRIPRDYVSKVEHKVVGGKHYNDDKPETSSILRKSDEPQTNKENVEHKLTTANLSKHVTILEKSGETNLSNPESNLDGRRDSNGSLTNYLTSRRISVDSLDVRRNSRRGSAASGEFSLCTDTINEVSYFIDVASCNQSLLLLTHKL